MANHDVYILGGLRTPIALRHGGLAKIRPEIFAAEVVTELLARQQIDAEDLSGVIAGNAVGTGGNLTRLMSLYAELPLAVPSLTVDMQCASGAAALVMAAACIKSGQGNLYLAGGFESASLQPKRIYAPADERHNQVADEDGGYYTAQFVPGMLREDAMLLGALKVIEKEQVTKQELDAWVLRSHQRAKKAAEQDVFADVILPIGSCRQDEGVRTKMSQKLLDRLPPLYGKGTLLNAGNACRTNDGAAFLLLASEKFCREQQIKPQYRLVASLALGGDPLASPYGAQQTAEALLARQKLTMKEMAAIEFNEAFAVIDVLFARKYPALVEHYNRFGGALAYGHPYAASGAIIMLQLMKSLAASDGRYGIMSIAGAGGMGEAILIERGNFCEAKAWKESN